MHRHQGICIKRCVCSRVDFADLKELADLHGAETIPELQAIREFGVNCRLCHPYVRQMLRDGTTEFSHIVHGDERS